MISFLLGISITLNIILSIIIILYIKFKAKKEFFNSDFIFDKDIAKDFLN